MLKIADFGFATELNPHIRETQRCGSPGYAAPELLNGEGYGAEADVFNVGVILYIMYCPFLYVGYVARVHSTAGATRRPWQGTSRRLSHFRRATGTMWDFKHETLSSAC